MGTTLKPQYGTAAAVGFGTGLQSLASSATGAYQSDVIDNTTALADDYILDGAFKTASGTLGTNPAVYVYVAASFDDTNFGGAYGSQAVGGGHGTYTLPANAGDLTIAKVKAINVNAENEQFNGVSVAALFGGQCPKKFVVIVNNQSGLALDSAAPGGVNVTPINWQQV